MAGAWSWTCRRVAACSGSFTSSPSHTLATQFNTDRSRTWMKPQIGPLRAIPIGKKTPWLTFDFIAELYWLAIYTNNHAHINMQNAPRLHNTCDKRYLLETALGSLEQFDPLQMWWLHLAEPDHGAHGATARADGRTQLQSSGLVEYADTAFWYQVPIHWIAREESCRGEKYQTAKHLTHIRTKLQKPYYNLVNCFIYFPSEDD